jgi:hypothetical protein
MKRICSLCMNEYRYTMVTKYRRNARLDLHLCNICHDLIVCPCKEVH